MKMLSVSILAFASISVIDARDYRLDLEYLGDNIISLEQVAENDNYYNVIKYENYIVFDTYNNEIGGFSIFRLNHALSDQENYENSELIFDSYRDLEDPWASWFMGISRGLLFVDFGTGTGLRGLEIHDLETGQLLYRGAYYDNDGLEFLDDNTLVTYSRISTAEVKKDYPEVFREDIENYIYYRNRTVDYGYFRVHQLNLATYEETDTGEIVGKPE
jgi:hypothetical protein